MATISTVPKPVYVYDGSTSTWYPVGGIAQANMRIYEYYATAGQTTFTGNDFNGLSLQYVAGALIVTLNGVVLAPGDDYTATNGTSVVLASGAQLNDILMVTAFSTFSLSNVYTKTEIDTKLGDAGMHPLFLIGA